MPVDEDTAPLLPEDTTEGLPDLYFSDTLEANVSTQLSPPSSDHDGGQKVGVCRRVVWVLRRVTIEPLLFLYITGWIVQSTITTNLLLEKVCQEKHYNEGVCANLSSHTEAQISVQQKANTIKMYLNVLTNIPGVFFVLFLGSWSDKHGRKILMLLPICGSFVSTLIYLGNSYWLELPLLYILLAAIPLAFTGGQVTLLMASYSYMADITKVQSRTMRIAFLDLGFAFGPLIGLLSSDALFYSCGYLGVYGVSGLCFIVAILYGVIRVEDTRGRYSKYGIRAGELSQQPGSMCRDLCDVKNVQATFRTAMKERPHKGRTKVLLMMAALCAMIFTFGSSSIEYLYTKRKFGWNYDDYVHLSLTEQLVGIFGTSFILPLFSFRLQVEDTVLAIVGVVSVICGLMVRGLAPCPWVLYLSHIVSCVGGVPLIITRSLISKLVPEEELGKVFSMLASWESIIPLLSNPLYTLVYNTSINSFPGAIYFLSASFYTMAECAFIWLFFHRKPPPVASHTHAEDIADICLMVLSLPYYLINKHLPTFYAFEDFKHNSSQRRWDC